MNTALTATVVICVYNRPSQVITCLESLLQLSPPVFEIVIVDDGSTDETPSRVQEFAAAHPDRTIRIVTHSCNRGLSIARNTGITASQGDIIFFTDSDCQVAPSWVSTMLVAFSDIKVAAAYGKAIDTPARNWAELAYKVSPNVSDAGWQKRPLIGNNMAFRRTVIKQILFDPAMTYYCDEVDVAHRLKAAGYHIAYVSNAIVIHEHPMSVRKYLVLAYRQAQGSTRYWYKYNLIGLDLLPLLLALLTAFLGLIDPVLFLVPIGFLILQLLFVSYAEWQYKGKSVVEITGVFPLILGYLLVRFWGVLITLGRIMLGSEMAIRESKRVWSRSLNRNHTQSLSTITKHDHQLHGAP